MRTGKWNKANTLILIYNTNKIDLGNSSPFMLYPLV